MHTLGACFAFPFNSWVAQCWHLWAVWYRLPRLWQLPFASLRLLHPFRWLHPYGVFPPNNAGPASRCSLLVEVSWDRKRWHEVDFHYSPSQRAMSPPRFVAPHHPRGDQAVIYETFGHEPDEPDQQHVGAVRSVQLRHAAGGHVLAQRVVRGARARSS